MSFESIILILLLAVVYWLAKSQIKRVVTNLGQQNGVAEPRIVYVNTVIQVSLTIVALIILGMIIGFNYRDLGLFFGSIFAFVGVALFAQWSILSNVTASVIVFFFFPYRVGDLVKILDGDNSIEGKVKEISLFHVILENEQLEVFTFPNSLVFQKAVQIKQTSTTEDKSKITASLDEA